MLEGCDYANDRSGRLSGFYVGYGVIADDRNPPIACQPHGFSAVPGLWAGDRLSPITITNGVIMDVDERGSLVA